MHKKHQEHKRNKNPNRETEERSTRVKNAKQTASRWNQYGLAQQQQQQHAQTHAHIGRRQTNQLQESNSNDRKAVNVYNERWLLPLSSFRCGEPSAREGGRACKKSPAVSAYSYRPPAFLSGLNACMVLLCCTDVCAQPLTRYFPPVGRVDDTIPTPTIFWYDLTEKSKKLRRGGSAG